MLAINKFNKNGDELVCLKKQSTFCVQVIPAAAKWQRGGQKNI
jgi:hypothetical protein